MRKLKSEHLSVWSCCKHLFVKITLTCISYRYLLLITVFSSFFVHAETVSLVKNIAAGANNANPRFITQFGNKALFVIYGAQNETMEVFQSDGTAAGTEKLGSFNNSANQFNGFASLGNVAVFNGYTSIAAPGGTGWELWKTEGTAASTGQLKDIVAGFQSSFPGDFTAFDDRFFFTVYEYASAQNQQLWVSNGTNGGTHRFKDFGAGFVAPAQLTVVNDSLMLFTLDTLADGRELYSTNGVFTPRLADIWPGPGSSNPTDLTVTDTGTYFTADDGINGRELWRTLGGFFSTERITLFDDSAGSFTKGLELASSGNIAYFAANDGAHGNELWKYNTLTNEVSMVADINLFASSDPRDLIFQYGVLYFSATELGGGRELWRSNGTAAGTYRVVDLNPGTASSDPTNLFLYDEALYFSAESAKHGREWWRTDGTAANTVLMRDFNPGAADGLPGLPTAVGDSLYLAAGNSTVGRELWKTAPGRSCEAAPKTLDAGIWHQISLPCTPPLSRNALTQIVRTPGVYGVDWIMFAFDTLNNSYRQLSVAEGMKPGEGYWLMSLNDDVLLSMPPNSRSSALYRPLQACASSLGCVETDVPSVPGKDASWRLGGNPYDTNQDWGVQRISTSSGPCSDYDGCSIQDADNYEIYYRHLFVWQQNSVNTPGTYKVLNPSENSVEVWQGYWTAAMINAVGKDVKLLDPQ